MDKTHYLLIGLIVIILAIFGTTWYTLDEDLKASQAEIAELENTLDLTNERLDAVEYERDELAGNLFVERERNEDFENQIEDIADTVGVLDKLSKTDKELLQKYSKVYFLNEHYIPESLSNIDDKWLYNENEDKQIHKKVERFLEDMLEDALDDDIELWVVSAYRSWGTQANLKGAYTVSYGAGANAFSADQGYSEHQLGTTVDFTTVGLNGGLDGFGNTEAYEWLTKHAHKYGFVLSYPENNQYYIYEPWHWRFVGEDLAKDLDRDNAHFYDWEQRKIDEYLISIFD